jgi:hypothetical protein
VIEKQDAYFVRHLSDSLYKYSEADIKGMLEFLIDNIHVVFEYQVFLWTPIVLIGRVTFIIIYEAEIVQNLLGDKNNN